MRKNILSKVRGAVTKTITKDAIRNLKIICPPINLQKRYIKILDKLNEIKSLFSKSELKIKLLKNFIEMKFFKIN